MNYSFLDSTGAGNDCFKSPTDELRTTLTVIHSSLSLLRRGKLDNKTPEGARLLDIALNRTDYLMRAIAALEDKAELGEDRALRDDLERLQLARDILDTIPSEAFYLLYQPIVQLSDARTIGFEALLRWRHPRRGIVSPCEFIPLAESTGAIHDLGLWAIERGCAQLYDWQQRFPQSPPLFVSVNLSGKQLCQPSLVESIECILETYPVVPESLKLEVTESVIIENAELAIAQMERLKALGVRLYLDDFGTGYSSLSRLHELPVDIFKVDRAFVLQQQWGTVEAMVFLARSLKLEIVIEGLETADDLLRARALGCDRGQGYFFSRPLEVAAAERLLETGAMAR